MISKAAIHLKKPRKVDAYRYAKWGLVHMALIFFFADLVASLWPAFNKVWESHAHLAIAVAAFSATIAEYINSEIEKSHGQ